MFLERDVCAASPHLKIPPLSLGWVLVTPHNINVGSASPCLISYNAHLFGDVVLRKQLKNFGAALKQSVYSHLRVPAIASLLF